MANDQAHTQHFFSVGIPLSGTCSPSSMRTRCWDVSCFRVPACAHLLAWTTISSGRQYAWLTTCIYSFKSAQQSTAPKCLSSMIMSIRACTAMRALACGTLLMLANMLAADFHHGALHAVHYGMPCQSLVMRARCYCLLAAGHIIASSCSYRPLSSTSMTAQCS